MKTRKTSREANKKASNIKPLIQSANQKALNKTPLIQQRASQNTKTGRDSNSLYINRRIKYLQCNYSGSRFGDGNGPDDDFWKMEYRCV